MDLRALTNDVVAQATGRAHRQDTVLAGSGGPAGNARLTAWTGLALLVLFLAELITLLDVRGLVNWHMAIGVLLVPPTLLKTGSTGWRMMRYYLGHRPYHDAGPPPLILRLLGPLVVVSTIGLLASGVTLLALGPDTSRNTLVSLLGQRVDAITIHQGIFVIWAGAAGIHTLCRLVPALRSTALPGTAPQQVPGRYRRATALAMTMVVAVVTAVLVFTSATAWESASHRFGPVSQGHHATPR
jgi:hypothetical protein